MRSFSDSLDSLDDRFLFSAEDDAGSDFFDVFEEGDAYALEDLLRLVKEGENFSDDSSAEDRLTHSVFYSDEDALLWGLDILCQSSLGRAIAFDARFEDWSLEVDDIEDGLPVINTALRILIVPRGAVSVAQLSRSYQGRMDFLINLARGLRLIWQDMHAVRPRTDLTADDQIFFERLRRADSDIIALRIIWDLRQNGFAPLWRHMIAGTLGDVAMVATDFWEEEIFPDGLAQTFLSWLACEHLLAECDNHTLSDMDARLQKSAREVCGFHTLPADDILNLSCLPDGISYLMPMARTLCYTQALRHIPDAVNEAHLRQILEECNDILMPSVVFRDEKLARKIFPDRIVDTLA